ncbi:sugar phosphate isomerase/epimerase family protein [Halogeometricum limi]|uniref:Sugar phosphate isomerase/epimerase n=1 Tax=Halogeometricum limi TaxID=555875 RepID=A0A1I6IEB8_9EURY|nr:sugar phosphate isomerase/epimerase family protein [Halogeometricum limi]SFR64700.1 Sugar phosphate isomerase/epimerase [Halogeometricum limi]
MVSIGINTWLYASFPVWTPSYTLEDTIDHVADAGFDSIEFGAASPHAWPQYMDEERTASISERLEETGLTVSSICPALGGGPGPNPASPLEAEREAAREHYMGCLDVAETFDSDIVVWVGGWRLQGQRYEDAWENQRLLLEDVLETAEQKGKTIAIEANAADVNLIETTQDQLRLLDEVDSSSAGVMMDTAHAAHRGEAPSAYVEELADDLVHLHLADTDRLPPGEGSLSFEVMFDKLDDVGYDGHYTAEIFGSHLNPDEAAVATRRNLASMLD